MMKRILVTSILLFFASAWTGWNWKHLQQPAIKRAEAIECLQMETLDTYQREASTSGFAAMHPAPRRAEAVDRLGKMIRFPVADGPEANAYFIPAKGKSDRWLIVIQEWWGLNDNIRDVADKYYSDLADMNVIAVDMYDGRVAATPDSAMKIMRSADMARMTSIIRGAIAYAGEKASIYSVGWCFGGMWSLQTAIIAGPKAKGTVMFYGRPESDMEKLKSVKADVIGFFGNLDKSPAPAMVDAFEQNMAAAGKKLTVHRYDAGHGFANPSNPAFNKSATEDSYAKAIAFFKAH
jgi:carboxymethylenebutenolidase